MLTILPIPFFWWLYLSNCLGRNLSSITTIFARSFIGLVIELEKVFTLGLLRMFEWCSLKLADITIATNESYKQVQMERANKRSPRYLYCEKWAEPDADDAGRTQRPFEGDEQVHPMLHRQPKSTGRR